jgi:hypothetical protein
VTPEAGARLGPYEIVALLGAGGMGEVYRARDTRLGREVAVKVLPRGMAADAERQQRFEAEARAAGALNHPNIVTLHDVGVQDGIPYLVTEVLEGESLRAMIRRGPIPAERAIELVVQLANGLTAAHAKGIVHRDLKPENLHILPDGRLKILDFGIAKLTRAESASEAETTPVFASLTAAGTIMGTVSYMAPEQLRDRPVDQRADLFAVGAILHELVTGKQPFTGETAADRVSAILMADPPALPPDTEREVPGIGAVIARLLAKRPESRMDTAADLAFTLVLLKGKPAPAPSAETIAPAASQARIEFRQLTFRDGEVGTARFAPDGQTIVYDAAWGGGQTEIYLTRLESPESSPLGVRDATIQAVSATAEIAAILHPTDLGGFVRTGTLARFPMMGGRPREIIDSVTFADWSPDGRNLAAIRLVDGAFQLEAPLGRVLHRTHAWMSHVRYSPDGSTLAFLDHPAVGNNAGHVCVVRPGEAHRRLTERYEMVWRLAWRADGKELWFGAQETDDATVGVSGVTLDGIGRRVFSAPGWAAIEDVARNGDALLSMIRPRMRLEVGTRTGGLMAVKDLSNLDWSLLRDLSPDGSVVLFDETGLGTAGNAGVYIRPTDGGPAVRLADGVCSKISPDGRWVLVGNHREPSAIYLVPTGAGETRRIELTGHAVVYASWVPGSDAIVVVASKGDSARRLYRVDLATQAIEPVGDETPVTGSSVLVSPDGTSVAARDPQGVRIIGLEHGESRLVPGLGPGPLPASWTADSRSIYMWHRSEVPTRVIRVDVETGSTEPWMEIWPTVRSGVNGFNSVHLTADGEKYACSYVMIDATLFHARGLT